MKRFGALSTHSPFAAVAAAATAGKLMPQVQVANLSGQQNVSEKTTTVRTVTFSILNYTLMYLKCILFCIPFVEEALKRITMQLFSLYFLKRQTASGISLLNHFLSNSLFSGESQMPFSHCFPTSVSMYINQHDIIMINEK